ncbi:MAG: ATP-binding protein [Chloroflexota bacterium]|nr:ATP-binding protein [Chloroflexota bacterium]
MNEADKKHTYSMTISLNVLNHLGIGLYSNVPAVLSEIVANAWDADAEEVKVNIDLEDNEIVIYDTGSGMTQDDINKKYLTVGYSKRVKEPGVTKRLGRSPMGRKGIGKLSVFSIADEVIVCSIKDGQRSALKLSGPQIQTEIGQEDSSGVYHPIELPDSEVDFDTGTKIILRQLRKGIVTAETNLRKRLARRFGIIGPQHNFRVWLNGKEITPEDRDLYDHVEILWYFDEESKKLFEDKLNVKKSFQLPNVVDPSNGYALRGWIGTVDEQKNIDDQNNTIVILAHGKLIQEDILKDFKEGGVYSKYLMGDVYADFMDLDNKDDIVTSDRQKVKETDDRYKLLKTFIQAALKTIQSQWTTIRRELGLERALRDPLLMEWYNDLRGDNKIYARQLFGKIESLSLPDKASKRELYKASLLAFERLALSNTLSILDNLETEEHFQAVTQLFRDIDDIEAANYYEIVKGRIGIIRLFENVLPQAKERLIQDHIFNHLWLLDPSWERASTDTRIEEQIMTAFRGIDARLTADEKKGRFDIQYRTAAGKHIIIELKKYDRSVTIYALLEQVKKYRSALKKCLKEKFPTESRFIEIICILGSPPTPIEDEEENVQVLRTANARYITYDTLITQTKESYRDYLDAQKRVSRLTQLLERFDLASAEADLPSSTPSSADTV